MDWSKIKTIFIISFLILDLYLMYQFLLIRDANKYKYVSEVSLEYKLKTDEITFGELPKMNSTDMYLTAKPKEFNDKDIEKLKDQSTTVIEKTMLHSVLDKPVSLNHNFDAAEAQNFVKTSILFGEQYGFWEMDEDSRTITFYQEFDNKMFYENISGKVILFLNDKLEITSYEQTYLDEIDNLTEKEEILSPIKGIETLYQKGLLKPKSKITSVELGYSTLVQLAASQVLTPTWHIVVEDNDHLYVNAFEGQIIQFNKDENNKVE